MSTAEMWVFKLGVKYLLVNFTQPEIYQSDAM